MFDSLCDGFVFAGFAKKIMKKCCRKVLLIQKKVIPLQSQTGNNPSNSRAFSSAGSEHLPYKQRVGGSNPSTPTTPKEDRTILIID